MMSGISFLMFHKILSCHCREKLEAFLLSAMERGLVSDGVLAQDINQAASFWHIREVWFSQFYFCDFYLFLWIILVRHATSFLGCRVYQKH